jgi:hypothetical protein
MAILIRIGPNMSGINSGISTPDYFEDDSLSN